LGGCTVVGDVRWTGSYGVKADVVARTHCSVEIIKTEEIHVGLLPHGSVRPIVVLLEQILVRKHTMILTCTCLQEILEKFEFFPIKCLIERAADLYKKGLEMNEKNNKGKRSFKTKVLATCTQSCTLRFLYEEAQMKWF
jgi:hypothetical protein